MLVSSCLFESLDTWTSLKIYSISICRRFSNTRREFKKFHFNFPLTLSNSKFKTLTLPLIPFTIDSTTTHHPQPLNPLSLPPHLIYSPSCFSIDTISVSLQKP
ncbi:hypothetical protein L2E82_30330 [Cichorium intybus]|uniref:Uncharacterized protein n=1 Tax=Cichorium intybus TaxID=13427 RepID=A0ACB9D0E5_CICIN|nr:hypothetical protein L2E82_30330 [Cichorium intybus]